jgi:hypothetical protein
MASASVVLTSDTSGSVTVTVPSGTAIGTTTLTLPTSGGTIQTSGSGFTTNGVAYASSTSALTTGTGLVFTGTNLGIGTTSPNAKLDILATTNTIRLGRSTSSYATIDSNSGAGSLSLNADAGNIAGGGSMTFNFAGTEAMRIDSSGNLGIGTTAPTSKLTIQSAGNAGLIIRQNTSSDRFRLFVGDGTSGYTADDNYIVSYNTVLHFIAGGSGTTEVMQLTSSGNLLVGTTTNSRGSRLRVEGAETAYFTGYGGGYGIGLWMTPNASASGGNATAISFQNVSNTVVGSISTTASATAFNTSSDYRLKNTIAPMTGALAKVALLKPVTYKWNVDGSDSQGFIAHELQEVVPECVTGEKDGVDEDGNPKYQGIDTSFLVATLTSALQELSTLITAQQSTIQSLTERITALEGART